MPPLQADVPGEGSASNHRIAYITALLPKVRAFKWLKYAYRHYNEDSVSLFKDWLVAQDWKEVLLAEGSQLKASWYQEKINWVIEAFFPLITVQRKNTDAPWINEKVCRLIRRRKAVYRTSGRSPYWKKLQKLINCLVGKRKETYQKSQKICLLADDSERNFLKTAKITRLKIVPPPLTLGLCSQASVASR